MLAAIPPLPHGIIYPSKHTALYTDGIPLPLGAAHSDGGAVLGQGSVPLYTCWRYNHVMLAHTTVLIANAWNRRNDGGILYG